MSRPWSPHDAAKCRARTPCSSKHGKSRWTLASLTPWFIAGRARLPPSRSVLNKTRLAFQNRTTTPVPNDFSNLKLPDHSG
jgi:hypothetical protein